MMPRFIVKLHKDIYRNLRWRTGVVLKSDTFQSMAVIKCDHDASRIYIYVLGSRCRDYFAAILYFLREINNSFEKLGFVERVPLPDEPRAAPAYENLLIQEHAGIEEFIPDGSNRRYNVKELLGIVQDEKATNEQILEVQQEILDKIESNKMSATPTDFVELKPNIAGIGLNLNAILDWIRRFVKSQR